MDVLLYSATLIGGAIWSGVALYNLAWLLDADNSTHAFKVLLRRALTGVVPLPIFWLAFWFFPTRRPLGWSVVASEAILLIASAGGIYAQLLLRAKSRAGTDRVSTGATRGFWLLLVVSAAFCVDIYYVTDFASRYSPGVAPGSRRVAWLLSFIFGWLFEGCMAQLWQFRPELLKTVREYPLMGARLIIGLLGLLFATLGLALMGVNHLGLQTQKFGWAMSLGLAANSGDYGLRLQAPRGE